MLIHFHAFHTSGPQWQRPEHALYASVDWAQVDAGLYACVDPMDNHALLYFSEREYKVQVRVSLSQDRTLVVLARPGDKPQDPSTFLSSSSSSKISPTPGITRADSKFWKRFLNFHLGNLGSLTHSKRKDKGDKDASVSLSRATLETLIPYWGLDLHFRLGGSLEPPIQLVLDLRALARKLASLYENHGANFVITKMKNTLFVLNKYLAGSRATNPFLLGEIPVGLNRKGIPSLLPLSIRRKIGSGDIVTIRMVTSLLNSFRAFEGTWNQVDLESITGPHPTLDPKVLEEFREFCKDTFWPKVIKGYLPAKVWEQCSSLETALKVGSTDSVYVPLNAGPNGPVGLLGAPIDARGWLIVADQSGNDHLRRWCEHVCDSRTLDLREKCLNLFSSSDLDNMYFESGPDSINIDLGRLGIIPEPAGKVRVVAIVDYWTQRVMKPVHDWMMTILRHLPTDGTFDQEGALQSLARYLSLNNEPVYSIDLKSATDLIPIALYRAVLEGIWPALTVDLWINLLTDRWFRVPSEKLVKKGLRGKRVRYGRGQPMGTLSSWPSMALVHHALTLFAAYRSGYDPSLYTGYRVLGDDNVTTGTSIAESYVDVSRALCVPTSPAKTLDGRLFIFAQQIYLRHKNNPTQLTNISPLSLKEELGVKSFGQRLEMALRAIRRGWFATKGMSIFSLLRLLMTRADYVRSRRHWTSGMLDKAARVTLISAFGLGLLTNMENILGLKSTIKPFLLSMLGRVEAVGGDQSNPRIEHGGSIITLNNHLHDVERNIAILFARQILTKLDTLIERNRIASIRFRMWSESVEETGYLPLYIKVRKGPIEPGLAIAPFRRDGGPGQIVTNLILGKYPGYPSIYKDQENKVLADYPVYLPFPIRDVEPRYEAYASTWYRNYQSSLWEVLKDTYSVIFMGTSEDTDHSYDDYVEDDGCGMSFSEENDTVASHPEGWSTAIPTLEVTLKRVRQEVQEIMEDLLHGHQAAPLLVLSELVRVVAAVERLPDFTSLGCFKASLPAVDELTSFDKKVKILSSTLDALGITGVNISSPNTEEFSNLRPGLDEALRELFRLTGGPLQDTKIKQGLSTG